MSCLSNKVFSFAFSQNFSLFCSMFSRPLCAETQLNKMADLASSVSPPTRAPHVAIINVNLLNRIALYACPRIGRALELSTVCCSWRDAVTSWSQNLFDVLFNNQMSSRGPMSYFYHAHFFLGCVKKNFAWLVQVICCFWSKRNRLAVLADSREDSFVALHLAAANNSYETAQMLLTHDAFRRQLTAASTRTKSLPMHIAAKHNCDKMILLFFEAAKELSSPPPSMSDVDICGCRPLEIALQRNALGAARVLLDAHGPCHHPSVTQLSSIHAAVTSDNVEGLQMLLEYGKKGRSRRGEHNDDEEQSADDRDAAAAAAAASSSSIWNAIDMGGNTGLLAAALPPMKLKCLRWLLSRSEEEIGTLDVNAANSSGHRVLTICLNNKECPPDVIEMLRVRNAQR